MKYLTVHVTQEDIDQGDVGNWMSCPIARATNRQLKPGYRAEVEQENLDIYPVGDVSLVAHSRTSLRAAAFIDRFDQKKKVKPATFRFAITWEANGRDWRE